MLFLNLSLTVLALFSIQPVFASYLTTTTVTKCTATKTITASPKPTTVMKCTATKTSIETCTTTKTITKAIVTTKSIVKIQVNTVSLTITKPITVTKISASTLTVTKPPSTVTEISTTTLKTTILSTTTATEEATITATATETQESTVTTTTTTTETSESTTTATTTTTLLSTITSTQTTTEQRCVPTEQVNMLPNGDFEYKLSGWNPQGTPGQSLDPRCDGHPDWVRSGECAVAAVFTTPTSETMSVSRSVTLCHGFVYDITYLGKITGSCVMELYINGRVVETMQNTGSPAAWVSWVHRVGVLPTQPLSVDVNILFRFSSGSEGDCGISLDNVQVEVGIPIVDI